MQTKSLKFDVVVCGGGLPGVCAAIAAARHGAQVALVEGRPVLGGNSSSEARVSPHGAVAHWHNRMARETGIVEELMMEYAARTPNADNRQLWDLLLREWCEKEDNLTLFLNTQVIEVSTENGIIKCVRAVQVTTETTLCLYAKIFVDATGDGFVAAEAGATYRIGREARDEFSETLAPITGDQRTLGSALYLIAYRRDYPVHFTPPSWAKKYLSCSSLPQRPHDIHFIKTINALSKDESAYQIFWWVSSGGGKDVVHDAEEIYFDLLAELMGVWDHLKNHCTPETREALRCYDLVWWPSVALKREYRRVEGDYIIREGDLFEPKMYFDRVAYGGWPIDLHPPEGIRSKEPPCTQVFLNGLYSIPYRALYSRDVGNLFLAGRCISATHVAMASLRVMCTLAVAAQAVGTAAAMCACRNIKPREIIEKGLIKELQQRLLRDDVYIIGLRNEDPDDLARMARVETTSDASLLVEDTDGYLELVYDVGQQVCVSDGPITAVSVRLKSTLMKPTTVRLELYQSSKIGHLGKKAPLLARRDVVLPPKGEGWFSVTGLNIEVDEPMLLWVCLRAHRGVYWGYSRKEAFGTRFAVRYSGPLIPKPADGKALIAPFQESWFPINHCGRLPEELHDWIESTIGIESGRKVRATLNVRFNPVQRPYKGENVINGIARAEDFPNIWISDPAKGLPQSLTLVWDSPRRIREILLTFDTDLDAPERMFGWPREKFRFPFPVPECVKEYTIEVYKGGRWRHILHIENNYHRRRRHKLEKPVIADKIRITVLKTNGAASARIYEVRVY